jgi:Papain family cysteine protease
VGAELRLRKVARARRSPHPGEDLDAAAAADVGHLADAPPPPQADLRAAWHAVGDQGHTASCVGWTVADSVLRWHLVNAGRLAQDERLSTRHVWMAAKESDQRDEFPTSFLEEDGTSLKTGLDVVRKFGTVLERELPWSGGLATGSRDEFYAAASERKIARYYNLGDDRVPDRSVHFDGWRRWMHQHGPVAVLVQLTPQFAKPGALLDDFDEAAVFGSHAAALFGYGPDHFLLRSSWGPGWGDGGYARMSLAFAAAAVIESYGVVI